ncbi:MAG TPA: hypothetical protein PJ991_11360 [Kiritimatiellia bacterium]|nr:hypothetical protein [Kiritimatiellia bacterium]
MGSAPEGLDFTGNPRMNLPRTYTGLPTITTSSAKTRKGIPLDLQWVGAYGQDEVLGFGRFCPYLIDPTPVIGYSPMKT